MSSPRASSMRCRLGLVVAVAMLVGSTAGCGDVSPRERLQGQVALTILHTSDIHSRLLPYNLQLNHFDAQLGLGEVDSIVDVGGAARMSYILQRERARSARALHFDSGDPFQGAPIFNYYDGEAEMRVMSAMGVDAMVIGNHEFDKGGRNLAQQVQKWSNFPALAANYWFEDPSPPGASQVGKIAQPYHVFDVDGLRVGAIGMGTLTSITSIYDMPNSLGITPLQTGEVAQFYIDLLRPLVDVVVVISHMGLPYDHELIHRTEGIDIVVGGHNHIALQPPKRVRDCGLVDENGLHYIELNNPEGQDPDEPSSKHRRYCRPREVILSHPGAFAKFVGRIDLILSNDWRDLDLPGPEFHLEANGFEVVSVDYTLFPINYLVPEDPTISRLLEPYGRGLDLFANLDLLIGYAPQGSMRGAPNGGDSQLGNLIANSIWLRQGVQTDFSMTNTTGIRADVVPGPVSIEQMFNLFPFDNAIAKMQLSGIEVQGLFDYIARRSAGRGCKSQAQIAGMRVVIDCQAQPDPAVPPGKATNIYIGPAMIDGEPVFCASDRDCCPQNLDDAACADQWYGSCDSNTGRCWQPMDRTASYEMGTSTYLANGGSGYRMLQRNTTQFNTGIQQRDALIDYLRGGKACGAKDDGTLVGCRNDADCTAAVGPNFVCACPGSVVRDDNGLCQSAGECPYSDDPGPGDGACVPELCRQDVAGFEQRVCDKAPNVAVEVSCVAGIDPCERGGEMCKFLACINAELGNVTDGRIQMVGK